MSAPSWCGGLSPSNFDKQDTAHKAMEDEAKAAKAGLWADGVEFEKPWLFRAKHNAGTR